MARIFKNKTDSEVEIRYANTILPIAAQSQADLSNTFEMWQLAASESLLLLLGQGTDKYQLNDGASDLTVAQAIDLIRAVCQKIIAITTARTASDGSPILAASKPDSPKLTFITPNWCDRTTWYTGSVRVSGETAADSGDHTTYNLAHPLVIDTYHGKITFEDFLKDADGYSYRVGVRVNDAAKTEQDPHFGAGGDYTVDYTAGKIVFSAALQPSDVVAVDYHYAISSIFAIAPVSGKMLLVDKIEVQYSEDIVMNDSFVFQAYGFVDAFAPQLMQPPYNIPSGTKIPLGDPLVYKTMCDLLNDSNHAYPAYPAVGGSSWRNLPKTAYVFAWDYDVGVTILNANYGMEIRVSLQHDAVCGGTFATAAFYCTSEDCVS